MVQPITPIISIDTGQIGMINAKSNTYYIGTKLKLLESVKNQQTNQPFVQHMEVDNIVKEVNENKMNGKTIL